MKNIFQTGRLAVRVSFLRWACIGGILLAAASGSAQTLLEADYSSGRVNQFSSGNIPGVLATGLTATNGPDALAFDSLGDLFIADYLAGKIYEVAANGAQSTFVSGLTALTALAIDSEGNLFVTSANNAGGGTAQGSVIKITPAGAQSTFATGFQFPTGLAFDHAGNLYVADGEGGPDTGDIIRITPSQSASIFATNGSANHLYLPGQLAFDRAGNLFVATEGGGGIARITPAGVLSTFATGMIQPVGLAFDPAGDLFVSDTDGYIGGTQTFGVIYEYTPAGTKTTFATGLATPLGLAFPPVPPDPAIAAAALNTAQISWPTPTNTQLPRLLAGCVLEQNPVLNSTNWTLTTTIPVVVNGNFQITINTATNNLFFRTAVQPAP